MKPDTREKSGKSGEKDAGGQGTRGGGVNINVRCGGVNINVRCGGEAGSGDQGYDVQQKIKREKKRADVQ